MEWERAKSYILIFLLLLNAGLGLLLFIENRGYTLTAEQERLIRTILSQNNISMDRPPPQRFPSMSPLDVRGFYYNTDATDALVQIFFENSQTVERRREFGGYVFQDGESRLIISNGFIFYENSNGFRQKREAGFYPMSIEHYEVTLTHAISLADEFVSNYFPNFRQDRYFVYEGIRIIYREEYQGMLVHSNFIEFLVTPVGITQIEMQFGEVLGHSGTPTMIFSPDEALLTFVQRVRHLAQESPITIFDMDLVYFQEYVSNQDSIYNAVPFYRIFTCLGDRPFLINAFTNVIID